MDAFGPLCLCTTYRQLHKSGTKQQQKTGLPDLGCRATLQGGLVNTDQDGNTSKPLISLLRLVFLALVLACFASVGAGLADDCTPPGAITSIQYPSQVCNSQVTVSWSAASGADSYTLERHSVDGAGYHYVYSGPATSFSQTVSPAGTYYYLVGAYNECGYGQWLVGENILVLYPEAPYPGLCTSEVMAMAFTVSWENKIRRWLHPAKGHGPFVQRRGGGVCWE